VPLACEPGGDVLSTLSLKPPQLSRLRVPIADIELLMETEDLHVAPVIADATCDPQFAADRGPVGFDMGRRCCAERFRFERVFAEPERLRSTPCSVQ
jgi:hypothetical protein